MIDDQQSDDQVDDRLLTENSITQHHFWSLLKNPNIRKMITHFPKTPLPLIMIPGQEASIR
jgi:hypothetical protein